jgi:hypothetical protein
MDTHLLLFRGDDSLGKKSSGLAGIETVRLLAMTAVAMTWCGGRKKNVAMDKSDRNTHEADRPTYLFIIDAGGFERWRWELCLCELAQCTSKMRTPHKNYLTTVTVLLASMQHVDCSLDMCFVVVRNWL